MNFKALAVLFLSSIVIAGCGGGSSKKDDTNSTSKIRKVHQFAIYDNGRNDIGYVYEYGQNGCSTGEQKVSSYSEEGALAAFCSSLKDEKKNKGCAEELRKYDFEAYCYPQVWSKESTEASQAAQGDESQPIQVEEPETEI